MNNQMMVYRDVKEMALDVAKSKMFSLGGIEQAATMMMIAQAEGRHPIEGVMRYHIINGKPSKKADAMLADFQATGGVVEWLEYNDIIVRARFSHPASPTAVTIQWTDDDVKRAGLSGGNHAKYPRQLKRARVISEGVRTCYPAACSLLYTPEEVEDFTPATVKAHVEPIKKVEPAHIEVEPVKTPQSAPELPRIDPETMEPITPAAPAKAKSGLSELSKILRYNGYTTRESMVGAINSVEGYAINSSEDLTEAQIAELTDLFLREVR